MTEEANIDTSYQLSKQKLILIGDVAVGKTSIINSLLGQKFSDEYEPSIGVDFFSKTISYKGKPIKLQIWDSAGQEKFKSLVILVYDISNKKSFDNLNSWIEFVNNYENAKIVICGNKIDLKEKREVSTEEGEKFSEEKKLDFFEVSAKDETNLVKMLFNSIISLPFFVSLIQEGKSKNELIDELEKENSENFTNREEENLGIGNEAKNKKLNVLASTAKRGESSLQENSIDQSEINKSVKDDKKVEQKKKKKKCC